MQTTSLGLDLSSLWKLAATLSRILGNRACENARGVLTASVRCSTTRKSKFSIFQRVSSVQ